MKETGTHIAGEQWVEAPLWLTRKALASTEVLLPIQKRKCREAGQPSEGRNELKAERSAEWVRRSKASTLSKVHLRCEIPEVAYAGGKLEADIFLEEVFGRTRLSYQATLSLEAASSLEDAGTGVARASLKAFFAAVAQQLAHESEVQLAAFVWTGEIEELLPVSTLVSIGRPRGVVASMVWAVGVVLVLVVVLWENFVL